jgi:hypothetical protein
MLPIGPTPISLLPEAMRLGAPVQLKGFGTWSKEAGVQFNSSGFVKLLTPLPTPGHTHRGDAPFVTDATPG